MWRYPLRRLSPILLAGVLAIAAVVLHKPAPGIGAACLLIALTLLAFAALLRPKRRISVGEMEREEQARLQAFLAENAPRHDDHDRG